MDWKLIMSVEHFLPLRSSMPRSSYKRFYVLNLNCCIESIRKKVDVQTGMLLKDFTIIIYLDIT